MAMMESPKILILDEPSVGLDPNQIIEVRNLIKSQSGKTTILFSSHILQEVEAICDRIVILDKGKVLLEDSISPKKRSLESIFKKLTSKS